MTARVISEFYYKFYSKFFSLKERKVVSLLKVLLSFNKIRLILNKAYFIYTKAEERSGKENYVIFITKKYTNFGLLWD